MKTNIIHKLPLLAAVFAFALSTSAQSNNTTSITLTTTSQPGETIRLLIKANGPVVAEGINGAVKTDSVYYSYPITDKTIKFVGDITNIGCHSSKLTNIDLINCTNLESLVCWNNQLTSLDVSQCPKLSYIDFQRNKVSTLDVSNCTKLQYLSCNNNELTSIKGINSTALTEIACYSNKLSSLDVSVCKNLKILKCHNNNITDLDLSDYTLLKQLFCYSNKLKSLKIKNCPSLKKVSCGSNLLNCSVMEEIAANLPQRDLKDNASFDAITDAEKDADLETCNVLTTHAVGVAKAKNWKVYSSATPGAYKKTEYAGRDVTCTNNSSKITFTTDKKVGETIKIMLTAKGDVSVTGLSGAEKIAVAYYGEYKLTSQTVTLSGEILSFGCNKGQLKTLDVSECPSLTWIDCYGNNLTQLDVSNCPELIHLYCNANQLTALDVTKCLKMKELDCYNNKITFLDLSKNTELTSLFCYANRLTSLDLTACKEMKHLSCYANSLNTLKIQNCTNLRGLECSGNKLTSLDVTNSPSLINLACSGNLLTNLDISKCSLLSTLFCDGNNIKCSEMEKIAIALPQKKSGLTGDFIAVTEAEKNSDTQSGNTITKHAVDIAKSKGWNVYSVTKMGEEKGTLYSGRDGNCTNNALSFVVTVSKNANGLVTVKGTKDLNAVPYGTELTVEVAPEAGYELDKLMANEEDITATKRFVVKSNVKVTATFKNGAEAVTRENIALYPNPASSEANLFGVAPQGEVSVYGTDGVRLLTVTADQSGHAVLRLEGLPEGNYLVTFRDAIGVLTTRQLTIKR